MRGRLLQHYAAEQAGIRPESPAVIAGKETLFYSQLERQSNQLANVLREFGCRKGDRVCLFLDKSPAAIIAMHGVLKAGGVYVPIDISSPASRVQRIIDSCEPRVVLAGSEAVKLLENLQSLPIVGTLGTSSMFGSVFDAANLANANADAPDLDLAPEDPAHILFTSGSTGTPKGVVLSHANVTRFVDWGREYFGMGPGDRNSGHPPLHFDLSTFDIYGTLSAGAQLHLVPAIANLLPVKLASFIRDSELTQWFSVPSVLTLMSQSDVIKENDFPSLRRLLWCGEVLPPSTLIHWMERLPHVEFTNLYGPTETTIASSYHTVEECPRDPLVQIPIGMPCEGENLMVLDDDMGIVPAGKQGNLYISGAGLSDGYWKDPEKTGKAFVDWEGQRIYRTGDLAFVDEMGVFHFLGRNDSQIKSRGYRIELGEIEVALNSLDSIRECAVVGIPSTGFDGTAIGCAYVPSYTKDDHITPDILRARASKLLPRYMLPKHWKTLDELPKTANGKSDRRKIREYFKAESKT